MYTPNTKTQYAAEKKLQNYHTNDKTNIFTFDTTSYPHLSTIEVSGTSSPDVLLGLWHNGKFIQSQITKNSKYKFAPVQLFLEKNYFKVINIDADGITSLVDSFFIDHSSARYDYLIQSVSKIQSRFPVLSITFDGGSLSAGADSILHILRKFKIKTTFFLTGKFILNNKRLTQSILEDGHEIGNHTYSHPHLTEYSKLKGHVTLDNVDKKFIHNELLKTDSVFYNYYQKKLTKLWRAPFGEYNTEILIWAAELGYKHIRWSKHCDLMDWVSDTTSNLYRTNQEMFQIIVQLHEDDNLNGSIILMHLGTERKTEQPYKILPKILDFLIGKKYQLKKITEILSLSNTS